MNSSPLKPILQSLLSHDVAYTAKELQLVIEQKGLGLFTTNSVGKALRRLYEKDDSIKRREVTYGYQPSQIKPFEYWIDED